MHGYSIYKFKMKQRESDTLFYYDFCLKYDNEVLGDNIHTCDIIKHRLSLSVMHHTIKDLIDDTLYSEISIALVFQITITLCCVMIVGSMHNRYLKTVNQELPVYTSPYKTIKND